MNNEEKLIFKDLTSKEKSKLVDSYIEERKKSMFEKMFGSNTKLVPMYIALVICILLLIVGLVTTMLNINLWNLIVPCITTALGFLFGKGSDSSEK